MPYETFELRFAGCGHVLNVPLQHNAADAQCYVCHPELRDVPAKGACPECASTKREASAIG
jgi:hypothetical protein